MRIRSSLRFVPLLAACLSIPCAASAQAGERLVARTAALPTLAAPRIAAEHRLAPAEREVTVDTTRLSSGRPELSLPLAVLGGVAGGTVGYGAGLVLLDCSDEGITCGGGPDNGEYKTMALGIALGAASGAYLGGKRRDSRGRWLVDLAAAAVGALPAAFPNEMGEQNGNAFVGLAGSAVAATLADYLVRRPRN